MTTRDKLGVSGLPDELKGVKPGAWQSVVRAAQGNFDHLMGILRSYVKAHNSLVDDVGALEEFAENIAADQVDADHTHDGTADFGGSVGHGSLSDVTSDQHHAQLHAAAHQGGGDSLNSYFARLGAANAFTTGGHTIHDGIAGQTAIQTVLDILGDGTFNTTAGALTSYGLYVRSNALRSAGANDLTNVGLYASASGGQKDYAALFDAGRVGIGTLTPGGKLEIITSGVTIVSLIVKAIASQTASLQEWQASSGNTMTRVSSSGVIEHDTTFGAETLFSLYSGGYGTLLGSLTRDNTIYGAVNIMALNGAAGKPLGSKMPDTATPAYVFKASGGSTVIVLEVYDGTAQKTFAVAADGTITIGPGQDVNLYRSAANVLKTDDSLTIGANLDHDGSNIGFFAVAPVARAAAYTQTYATADKTHAAFTSADLAAFTGGAVGFLDAAERDGIRTQFNALRADVADLKQLANSIIDDLQAYGLLQ